MRGWCSRSRKNGCMSCGTGGSVAAGVEASPYRHARRHADTQTRKSTRVCLCGGGGKEGKQRRG
eukprot:5741185-Pleurochrysis_carterae.AAC.2